MSIFAALLDAPAAEEPPTIGTVHAAARAFVAAELAGRGESHGLGHSLRVRNLALAIFDAGGLDARGGAGFDARRVVELAALLHDVCDHKYVDAATAPGAAAVARRDAFLAAHASPAEAAACVAVIAEVSYSREAKARRRGEAPAWRALDEPARTLRHVVSRAAQESEIPNFKGSDLGHFPLVLADLWTSDHLSGRSRSMNVFFVTRARGTLTLK